MSELTPDIQPLGKPVRMLPTDPVIRPLLPGPALCLSGGGYRAMLFHLGALWRLNDAGWLSRLEQVSSVSGGSITAGLLGLKWTSLGLDKKPVSDQFVAQLAEPIRRLARRTIDVPAILCGLLVPGWIANRLTNAYAKHLLGDATLADLPAKPRFVFNATNVQTGALWRFSREHMADWRVGLVPNPTVRLAVAVAASTAFPPVLSPLVLNLKGMAVEKTVGATLHEPPYTESAVLTDGGVYDNLGLETVWKKYAHVLVSDAGMRFATMPRPWINWISQAYRAADVMDNQVRSLRKRDLIASYQSPDLDRHRDGAYWGIATDIGNYQLPYTLACPEISTSQLAGVPTRLASLADDLQERLINWGYAVCDAALRKHVDTGLATPRAFPYSRGVG